MNSWFTPLLCFGLFTCVVIQPVISQNTPLNLIPVATHHTGLFDLGAAEAVAYDPTSKRLFYTNAQLNHIGILDIRKPETPVLVDSIPITSYGDIITGIAMAQGKLAVAIAAFPNTEPGNVVLFNASGTYQAQFKVGALPRMIAFTPDGKTLLVANEGAPAEDYSVDPEGSVSIISLERNTIQTASFTAFNTQAATLRNRGVRLFGNGASVAQDLEPESLTISPDGKKAFVILQENNALAIVDIATASVVDIQALGYKDYKQGIPQVTEVLVNQQVTLPVLGTPVYKDSLPAIRLGGFSGLYFDKTASSDSVYVFYTLPDRGPTDDEIPLSRAFGAGNEQAFVELRPYKLPDYQARMVRLLYNKNTARVTLDTQIYLSRIQNNGRVPITGRTNVIGYDEIPVTYARKGTPYEIEDWVDTLTKITYTELPFDPFGGAMGGLVRDRNGFFWVCDETRPSLYKFQPDGLMVSRFVPRGTSALGLIDLGQGSYGDEILPAVYRKRWGNRGFEAIAYDSAKHIIYAFLQSPLYNPNSTTENNSDVIRILGINADNGVPLSEYVYLLENNRAYKPEQGVSRVDRITDAVYTGNGTFLVLETDSTAVGVSGAKKFVYEINIQTATNLLSNNTLSALSAKEKSTGPTDKTLEMMQAADLEAAGIRPVHKRKVLNLPSVGYTQGGSPEGLALLPDGALAVLNDNDYGRANGAASDIIDLGIISFEKAAGFDANDQDNKIDIAAQPVLGMYQPDGITTFSTGGKTYLLTANEGKSRAYTGLEEEVRVGSSTYVLDAQAFPNATTLKQNTNLGRLYVSNASGDLDKDGDFDQIYTFGSRSFSVWDTYGNQVFDSGNAFEVTIRDNATFSPYFNTSNRSNATSAKDSQSDDKGPEPTAIEVAVINNTPYALIGLNQIGGIMAYNLTNPTKPVFAGYFNNRNFSVDANTLLPSDLGLEHILFIPESSSPTGVALVVTANAVSGTVTIFATRELTTDVEDAVQTLPWSIYPNPATESLYVSRTGDYQVYNTLGQVMLRVQQANQIDISNLPEGTYLLRSVATHDAKLFVVTR